MKHISAIFALIVLPACQLPAPAPIPHDAADAEPGPPPMPPMPVVRACEGTLKHLAALGCTPWHPSSGSWVDVCKLNRQNGGFQLKPLDEATTIDEANRAGAHCIGDGGT